MASEVKNGILHVGLLWHTFGQGNLGIDALARGHAELIRRAALKVGVPLHMTSFGSGQKYRVDIPNDVSIGPAPRLKPLLKGQFDFPRAIRACDIVFDIGEGDSFTDIYGARPYARVTATKVAVLIMKRPLVLAPQTIGPFDNLIRRRIAISIMHRARGVFTRDAMSTAFLRNNGFLSSEEFIDVAFAVPIVRQERTTDRTRVCIVVSGLLYNGGLTGQNELGMTVDYKQLTHSLIEYFLDRADIELHLLAHVHGAGNTDDDIPVVKSLAARYHKATEAPLFRSFSQAQTYLSGMDFVVSGRLHACISAFSAGVPVLPIAYSRKFNGLFNTLGYRHFVDGKVETTDQALRTIAEGFAARATLAEDIAKGLVIVNERLSRYENRLTELLAGVRGRSVATEN